MRLRIKVDTQKINSDKLLIRPAKPINFNGTRKEDVEVFINSLNLYFVQSNIDREESKVLCALSYLRGPAAQWARIFYKGVAEGASVGNWEQFVLALRTIYGQRDEEAEAKRKLNELVQTDTVMDYAIEFNHLKTFTSYSDYDLRERFTRGLKPKIKEKLAFVDPKLVDTLPKLFNEAIRFDNLIFQLQADSRNFRATHSTSFSRPKHANNPASSSRLLPLVPPPKDPNAMDIDATRIAAQGDPQPQRRPETRACYNCGKAGHLSRNCQAPRQPRNQIRAAVAKSSEPPLENMLRDFMNTVNKRFDVYETHFQKIQEMEDAAEDFPEGSE